MMSFRLSRPLRLAAVLVALAPAASSQVAATDGSGAAGYALTAWATEDGLPGDIFAIAQDLDGYLWLGTPAGLLRFDGTRFTPWVPANGPMPTAPVHALIGSQQGGLWVGFGGGAGVARVDGNRLVRYNEQDGAPPGVNALLEDRQGVIWAAGLRGLFRFASGRWSSVTAAHGYEGREAFSLHEDGLGRLWVGTAAGVYVRSRTAFELVDAAATNVQDMVDDEAGAIWTTDTQTIVQRLGTHRAPAPAPGIRLPTSGWRLMRDRRGGLWVATFGGGLLRIEAADSPAPRLERVDYEQQLSGSPRSLFEDRDGTIWVGMRGGLLRLARTSFETVGPLDGLTNEGVRTAAIGPDGDVWIATGHNLNRFSRRAAGRQGSGTHTRTSYAVPQVLALLRDRRGAMWVSTSERFGRLEGGRLVPAPIPDLPPARVTAMADDGERIWLCTTVRGVMTWNGRTLARFEREPDIGARSCQSILTDRQDRVWIGFVAGGAAMFDRGVFRQFTGGDGLTPGTVLAILEGRNGAIWFATSGGVSRYHNGRFTALTRANAPLDGVVPVLVEDDEGYVWVGVNSGSAVVRFHPAEVDKVAGDPAYRVEYALYDETDGMQPGAQMWQSGVGGVRDGDGRLWVATGLGMTTIDPRQLPRGRGPSPPHLLDVVADGERIDLAPDLTFARGTTLRVEYGALSLSSASKLRFRHMLDGVDDEWVYDDQARAATYQNLTPGNYRFRVSTTHDGQWTDATVWAFTVAPPFYLTRGFLAGAAAALAGLVALAWWLRLRAIDNRYALVFAERARVSREIHDTLLQSLAALGTELEALASQPPEERQDVGPELRRIRRQVGHSLREARDSILELRRSAMRTRRLVDSLQDFVAAVVQRRGVETELVVAGRRPDDASGEVDMQLFRIAQEAVNNAIRHGRATRIRITVAYEHNRVALTVQDNGCGFSPDAEDDPARLPGEHFGLLSMRERAERIHGRLRIESSPGRGTTIETMAPVRAA